MKILIVDDHLLFLEGVSQILSYNMEDVEVIKANSVEQAIQKVISIPNIDLALVDLKMPNVSGVELLSKIKEVDGLLPIAVLSATDNLKLIKSALMGGAQGFIPKTYPSHKLISAIDILLSGESYISNDIQSLLDQAEITIKDAIERHNITGRQLDVLMLLAQGLSNQKIAQTLFISEHTVKSHLKQLFQKLNCDNRLNCVKSAQQLGLIAVQGG